MRYFGKTKLEEKCDNSGNISVDSSLIIVDLDGINLDAKRFNQL